MSDLKICVLCETPMQHATGIGYFCPSFACKNLDGPFKCVPAPEGGEVGVIYAYPDPQGRTIASGMAKDMGILMPFDGPTIVPTPRRNYPACPHCEAPTIEECVCWKTTPRQSEPEGLDGTLETNRKLRFALDNARGEFREALAVRDAEIAKLYDRLTSIGTPSATEKGQELKTERLHEVIEQVLPCTFRDNGKHDWACTNCERREQIYDSLAALGTTEKGQVQISGPQCKQCGGFTTYTRVKSHGLCMKCENSKGPIG